MKMNCFTFKGLLQFGCFALLISFFTSCKSSKQIVENIPTPIDTYEFDFVYADNLSAVLKLAEKENKLVFIDVYATWCLPCKMMDRDVFTHQETADKINKNFI